MSANSSPPYRQATSISRTLARMTSLNLASASSPDVAVEVVHHLEVVEVEHHQENASP
jgi:hypothetical protein